MPRERYKKKREDYRSGGRVRYNGGTEYRPRQDAKLASASSGKYYAGGAKTAGSSEPEGEPSYEEEREILQVNKVTKYKRHSKCC